MIAVVDLRQIFGAALLISNERRTIIATHTLVFSGNSPRMLAPTIVVIYWRLNYERSKNFMDNLALRFICNCHIGHRSTGPHISPGIGGGNGRET
jgi:hypothetical protein